MADPAPIAKAVAAYSDWLKKHSPTHLTPFEQRQADDIEAAQAEAAVFTMLLSLNTNPSPAEDVSFGGLDFVCAPKNKTQFAVEVTAVRATTLKDGTGLPIEQQAQGGSFAFSQATWNFLHEAVNKAPQLADYPMPRVLAIVCSHPLAHLVFGTKAAQELLTGTTSFQVPIGGAAEAVATIITKLENSVFFKPGKTTGTIEPARQSISAILLCVIGHENICAIGLLHPEPAHAFDFKLLPGVHFAKLSSWLIVPAQPFGVDWVGMVPRPKCVDLTLMDMAAIEWAEVVADSLAGDKPSNDEDSEKPKNGG